MAFMSMDDPDFWAHCPQDLKHLQKGLAGLAYFLLGDRKDDPPTVVALRMEPGWVLPRHAHPCHRFEIVVQGTLDVGERVLKPGDIMMSDPGVAYGPHVAGPEGCTTFEIFSNHKASYVTLMDTPEGTVECDISTPAGMRKMREMMKRAGQATEQFFPKV
ncbi:MAG: cupin domain-containing protein [Candidatus Binatia bacterium]